MADDPHAYEVLIIGGGPAGATAALQLARVGRRVAIFEKTSFPRFHVGESMQPYGLELIQRLGLEDRLAALPQIPKIGAEFAFGDQEDDQSQLFLFEQALLGGGNLTFNVERSYFDQMLLEAASEAGAEVFEDTRIDQIVRLDHHDVALRAGDTEYTGRWLIDASGQSTVVGRHLSIRRHIPALRNVAYFGHYRGVQQLPGELSGVPTIAMCEEGWFWLIQINPEVTSCGLVMSRPAAKAANVPAPKMLHWGIERCPLIRRRTADAQGPPDNGTMADFSYHCRPYAGRGYFLVGDAATFVDPIFSTGVCLGMSMACTAAEQITAVDDGRAAPNEAARLYAQSIDNCTKLMFDLVGDFYNHHFREMMMNGSGPASVHRAVIAMLAGRVFPRPDFAVYWRYRLLQRLVTIQRFVPLVPRHKRFSLLHSV